MREFYLNLLQNLDMLTGHRQYEKLRELPNYKDEINRLLDVLCRVSNLFPYIPEEAQKNIISDSIITDLEFTSLNARIIYKWFNIRKDIYFKEVAHQPTQLQEVVTGEKREEWLKIWQQEIAKFNTTNTSQEQKNSGTRMRESLYEGMTEDQIKEIEKARELASESRKRKQDYRDNNYDKEGNALETWLPEDEWMKKNYQENNLTESKQP